ncbi:LETM1 domain-containing protein mdm28, mitochondrial [Talaromyces islandicus]|uniref:LETM1 domain-containing protein mdm28, mitochondrial n=1 Tax=Talaromyces islandicus TaxID=28573 RepID=A0A0U1LZ14_TALIS|nr:LETM1 domain-containing protein mdm28, mitochondrial [Talaromyces islandicus]
MRTARLPNSASAGRVYRATTPQLSSIVTARPIAHLHRRSRAFPTHQTALAILIPLNRTYSTGPSTSTTGGAGGGSSFPPPGFDAEKAKKPLPSAETRKPSDQVDSKDGSASSLNKDVGKVAESAASGGQKTTTETEKRALEKAEPKKMTIGQKIKHEIQHYWDGTKLLATEVRISVKLAMKMAAGYELSRRENRQLQRTVQDLARLVPFSVFVIVPFAELLLPVALRLFPNMLPSTYEGQKSRDAKAETLRGTRKEVSAFLQDTLRETGLPLSAANAKKEEFTEFFRKVRSTGESPSAADVIKVCKIFKDDLTLDNLSRPQLVGMCKYMNLNTFGTDAMLRYNVRHRMRQIKRDDRAIYYEGVDSLSVPELQMACASRGLRTHGMSPARLRDDLSMWLDLRLNQGVPSTLLVLSNAYQYTQQQKDPELSSQIDALRSVLSSIPEELFHEIELEVHNAEGAATNKQRLEVVKEQQELIEEENEQNTENEGAGVAAPKDIENIDDKEDGQRVEASDSKQGKQISEADEAAADAETAEREAKQGEAAAEKKAEKKE